MRPLLSIQLGNVRRVPLTANIIGKTSAHTLKLAPQRLIRVLPVLRNHI